MNQRTKAARERAAAARPLVMERTAAMLRNESFKALLRGEAKRRAKLVAANKE